MKVLLIYHFFHPDPVISARLFSDLAAYLAGRGAEVTVYTSNRLLRSPETLPKAEEWQQVQVRRFRRPGFLQSHTCWRLLNSAIMMLQWLWAFFRHRRDFDAVLLGTDPQFSYLIFPFFRLMNRRVKLFHWVFDLYPDAGAASPSRLWRLLVPLLRPLLRFACKYVDCMVDIGPCMRRKLLGYGHRARCETLTPWALVEPEQVPAADPAVRRELFGDAAIGLLYSGTVGHAHDIRPFIELARECRKRGIDAAFCFAGYGNCYGEQISGITPADTNIRIADFVPEAELEKRLVAADIHLVSLRRGLEGLIVPSKFFAALATGRAVLFSGSEESEIAGWCREHQAGFTLGPDIFAVLQSFDSPEKIRRLRENARRAYQEHFSRELICRRWYELLKAGICGR